MPGRFWRKDPTKQTLDDLEPPAWPPVSTDAPSGLRRCHELRQLPPDQFSVEDIRLLIAHLVALPVTVPLALEILRDDPMVRADRYFGDLLLATMAVPGDYWQQHPEQRALLYEIYPAAKPASDARPEDPGVVTTDAQGTE